MELIIDRTKIFLKKGDITRECADAIVNAANSSLMGGGGVDGAIHRAGGSIILEECRAIISKIGRLDTGKAVITSGGNLAAEYVIHTVGPIWHGGDSNEESLLTDAYFNSLKTGAENNLRSIAFPSISTGVYGYPIEKASLVAFNTVIDFVKKEKHEYAEVKFVVFSDYDYSVYEKLFLGF